MIVLQGDADMKRVTPFLIILCLMFMVYVPIAGAQESPTADVPLMLFPAYLQMPLGKLVMLDAETYPVGKKLAWTALNPSVATVDENGCVTPVAVGETYVVCAFVDDVGIAEACGIRVTAGGNMYFWEYTPEPLDLDKIIAEMEQVATEQGTELIDFPDVPWPDAWPNELPQMEGKVDFATGTMESEYGLVVTVAVEGKDVVETYVMLLTSMSFNKGMESAYNTFYYIELNGKGYKVVVSYDDSEKNCTLMVRK